MKHTCKSLKVVVSQNIKSARLEAGLTQQALADKSGFQVSYVARLETGQQNISLEVLEKISISLKKSPSELVSENASNPILSKQSKFFFEGMKLLRVFENQLKIS